MLFFIDKESSGTKRSASATPTLDCKENDLDNKSQSSCGGVEVKQERLIDVSHEDDYSSLSNAQPPLKKLRAEVADAESNTTNSGKFHKKILSTLLIHF